MLFLSLKRGYREKYSLIFLVSASLAGCVSGAYQDPTEQDVAKIRFVSDLTNATFDYIDDKNCGGVPTGLLNNWLVVDTRRRVSMSAPPPQGAKNYIEIKLISEKEVMFRANTLSNSGGSVCGLSFKLRPEANAEYEAEFSRVKNYCVLKLSKLHMVDEEVERVPLPINRAALDGCAG